MFSSLKEDSCEACSSYLVQTIIQVSLESTLNKTCLVKLTFLILFFVCFRTIVLISLFSQYLTKVKIPVPRYNKERGALYAGRFPLFKLFPVSIGGYFLDSVFVNLFSNHSLK